jgi:hypothetical protein
MRPPVLIIGAHRSGTSATARGLELLGLQIGQRLDSHRESKALQRLHEEYLGRTGAAWHNPRPFLESIATPDGEERCTHYLDQNIRGAFGRAFGYRNNPAGLWLRARLKMGEPWGWKEPRTTLFAASWQKIFPETRFIHVLRDERAAAASIRQRELRFQAVGDPPTGQTDDFDYCLEIVRAYVEAGKRMAASPHYRLVAFEQLRANPREILSDLAQFCDLNYTSSRLTNAAATIHPARV